MFGSLFRKRKKTGPASGSLSDSIKDGRVGDVFTVTGLSLEYEDSYFIIEKMNRYEGYSGESYELLGVDGDKRLWVQWSDAGGLFVAVTVDDRPMGLKQLSLTEENLVSMDEEHSVDNYVTYEGTRHYYRNSGEAVYYEDNLGAGVGFYLWEFTSEDGKLPSVTKWEGQPFQAYVSEVVSPDSVTLYKR